MNFKIIFCGARYVTIELDGSDIYKTAGYEVWIDSRLRGVCHKMVQTIDELEPDTDYEISLARGGESSEIIKFHTKQEPLTLNVRDFGAYGDGVHDDTSAIQAAILCCPPNARVYVGEGTYLVTALFLKSNMTLELDEDCTIAGIFDREKIPILPGMVEYDNEQGYYNLGSWEGNPLDTFASLLTGINVENVTICGKGSIDGRADFDNWWRDTKLRVRAWRPRMIFLNHCKNITVVGITVKNSPAWNLHPYFSENISFIDMEVKGPANSHNTDGCDPESCTNVDIVGVHFSVGDDCIAIKSGKIYMGRTYKAPSNGIHIRQCWMQDGHGAVTVGSEIAAGVKDIRITSCRFSCTDRGLRVKTRRGRGKDSVLKDIVFENLELDGVKAPFVVNSFYFCDPDGRTDYVGTQEALPVDDRTPKIESVTFKNIVCRNAHYCGAYIYGLPEQKIDEITFENVSISYAADAQTGVAAMMTGCLPSCKAGLVLGNVKKLTLKNVVLSGQDGEELILNGVDSVERN